jgi:ABC-type transport system involved in Fe-S cluster assembly fused permease/ATPase subunit
MMNLATQRVLQIAIPQQTALIMDRLGTGIMPWKEIALWIIYKWLGVEYAREITQNYTRKRLQDMIFHHVMNLSMSFHSGKSTSELIQTMDQVESLSYLVELGLDSVCPMVFDFAVAIWCISQLFGIHVVPIVLSLGLLHMWSSTAFHARVEDKYRIVTEKSQVESSRLYEAISMWQTVTHFNRIPYEMEQYTKAVQNSMDAKMQSMLWYNVGFSGQYFLRHVSYSAALLLVMWEIHTGRQTVGSPVAFFSY